MAEKIPLEFSKAWFKKIVKGADEVKGQNPSLTLHLLLEDLHRYIDHIDKVDAKRGAPGKSSARKKAAVRENGKKGGRPRKIKEDEK